MPATRSWTPRTNAANADLLARGGGAAAAVLRRFHVPTRKALDPTNDADFMRIVVRLSNALAQATEELEAVALADAMDKLDVDWTAMDAAQIGATVDAAKKAVATIPKKTLPKVDQVLESAGPPIAGGTKRGVVERHRLTVKPNLSTRDRTQVQFLRQQTGLFVKDQYLQRADVVDQAARDVVSRGLDDGLGSRRISENLREEMLRRGVHRSKNYWDVVSSAFVNRTRTMTELGALDQAGIERFVFEAVLDERTTEVCRMMHGQSFSVKSALRRVARVNGLANPEDVKHEMPWLRTRKDEDGNPVIAYKDRDGSFVTVARVDEAGYGERDRIGRYSGVMREEAMARAGIQQPPLHGLCRSRIVGDL